MRVGVDDLIFWGVCALDELIAASAHGPIAPNFAVKTILAFLHAHSDGNKDCYQAFWKAIGQEHAGAWSEGDKRYLRSTNAQTALNQIMRGLGFDGEADTVDRLSRARHGPPKHPSKQWTEAVEAARQRRLKRPSVGGLPPISR